VPEPQTPAKPKSRRRILIAAALIALLALAGIGVGYKLIRNYYYVSAYDGSVAIMRGLQGSILGVSLQQPYLLGCVNDRGELSQISPEQNVTGMSCTLMRLQDLRPPGRAQVTAGLPAGSLDDAIGQMRELAHNSLLPKCVAPTAKTPAPSAAPRSGSTTPAAPTTTKPTTTKPAPGPTATPKPTTTPTATSQASATPLPAPPQKPGIDCRAAA
jgi:protein phosphatase